MARPGDGRRGRQSRRYGDETTVVRLHSGNGPHREMNQRAIACFGRALEDIGLTGEPLRQVLHDYFAWATTTTMSAYPGPNSTFELTLRSAWLSSPVASTTSVLPVPPEE